MRTHVTRTLGCEWKDNPVMAFGSLYKGTSAERARRESAPLPRTDRRRPPTDRRGTWRDTHARRPMGISTASPPTRPPTISMTLPPSPPPHRPSPPHPARCRWITLWPPPSPSPSPSPPSNPTATTRRTANDRSIGPNVERLFLLTRAHYSTVIILLSIINYNIIISPVQHAATWIIYDIVIVIVVVVVVSCEQCDCNRRISPWYILYTCILHIYIIYITRVMTINYNYKHYIFV